MAVKSKYPIVAEWSAKGMGRAVSRRGDLLTKDKGGTWKLSRVKRGLSIADLERIFTEKGMVRVECRVPENWVPNPIREAEKRDAAARKRIEKRKAQDEAQLAYETALVAALEDSLSHHRDSDPIFDAVLVAYLRDCVIAHKPPIHRVLDFVYLMARFHSGNGYLGTMMRAEHTLPEDYPYRKQLNALADKVADAAYGDGANLRAAIAWGKALGRN